MATPDEIKKWRAQFTSLLNDQNVLSNTGNNSLLSMLNDAKSVGLVDDSFIQKYRTFRQARLDWARSQPIPDPQTGQPLFKVNARKQTVPVTGSDLFVNGEFRPDLGLRGVKAAREERMKGLQTEADADVKRLGGIAEALAPSSPLGNIGMGLQAVTEAVRSIPTTGRLAASGLTGGFIAPPSATQIRDTMVQKPFEDVLAMTPEQARLEAMKPARAGGFAFGEGLAPTLGGIVGGQAAGTGLALSGLAAGPLAPVAVPTGYFLGSLGGAFLAGKAQEWLLKNAYGDKAYTEQIAPLFGQALDESGTAGMAGSFGNVLLQGSPVLSSGIGARRTLALAKAAWTGKPVTLQGTLDELGMTAANRAESVNGALLPNIVARVQPGSKYEAVVSPLLDRFASAGKQVAEANRYKLFSPQSTGLGGRMVEFGKFVQQTPGASDFVGDLIGEQFGNLGQSAYDYMQAVKKSKETGEPVNTAEMLANLAFGSLFIGNNRFTDSISQAAGTIGGGAVEAISRIPVVGEPVEALQRRYSEQNKGLLAGLLREPAVQDVRAGIPTAYQERIRPRQRLTAATETRQALAPEQVAVALGGGEAVVFNKNTGEAQPRVSFNELFGAIDDTATVQQGQGISEALSNIPTERSGRYLDRLSAFGGRDIIPQVGQFRQQVVGLSKSMDSDTGHVIVREQVEDIDPTTGKPDTVAQYRALRLSDLEAGNQSLAEELLRSAGLAPSNEIYGGAIVAPEFLNEGDLDSPFSVLAAWQRSMAFQGGLPENVWREFPTVVSFDRGVELATRIVGVEKNGDLQVQILSPTMDIVRVSGENVQERRGERTTTQQLDPVSLSDLLNEADISDLAVPKADTTADVFANPDSGIHAVAFDADTILPIQLTKEQRARIPAMADALNNAVNQAVRDGGANAGKSARKRFIANGLRSLFGGNTLPSSGYDYEVGSTLLADRPSGQEWGVVLRNTEAGPLVAFPSNDLKPVVVQDSDVKESSRTKREGERPSVDSAYDEAVAIDRLGGEDGGTAALQLAQSLLDQYEEDPERFLGVESLAEILSMTESKGKIIGDKQEAIDRFNKIVNTLEPAIDGTDIEENIRGLFGLIEEAINNASFVKPLNAKALEGRTVDEYKGMDRVDINAGLSSIKSPLDKAKYLVGQILRMGEKLSDESQLSSIMERLFGIEVKDNVATGNLSTVLKRAEVYRDKIAEVAKSKDSDLIEQANQAIDTLDRLVAMAEGFKFSGRRVSAGVRRTSSVKTIDDYAAVSSLDPSVILTEYRNTKDKARAFTGIIERVRKAIESDENLDPMVEILGFGKIDGVYTLSDNPKLKEPWIGNPETSQWQYVVKRFNGIKSALVTAMSVDLDNIDRFNAAVDYLDTVIEPALAQRNADGSIKFKYSGKPIKEEEDAQAEALRKREEAQAARAMTEKQIAAIRGSNPYTRNADGDLVPVVIKGQRRAAGTRFAVGSQGKRNLAQEVVELTYRSIADGTDLALTPQQQAVRDALEMPNPDTGQEWYRSAMQGISFLNDAQIRGIISNIGYAVLENKGAPLTLDSEFKFFTDGTRPLKDTEKSILSDAGWVLADGVIDKSGVKIYGASERGYRYGTVLNQTSESETGDPEEAVSRLFGLPAVDGEMDLDFTEIRATDKLSFGNALVSAYAKTKAGKGKKKEAIEKDFAPVVELFDTIIHGIANRKVDMLLDGIEIGAFSTRRNKEEAVSATRKYNMQPHSLRPMYDELQPMYQRLRELLGLEKNADIIKTLSAGGDRAKEVRAAIAQLVEETAEDFYMNRMPTIADFQVIPEVKNKMGQYLKIYDEASGVSTKVIMAFKAATIDTFVHEIAHAIFEELPYALKYEISSALGHKLRVPTLLHDSVITYEAQEKFAYGLELALANMSRLEQPWAGVNVSKDRKFSGPLLDVLLGAASVVEGAYTALTSARANNREIRKILRKGPNNEAKQLFERDWKIPYRPEGRVYLWFKAPVIIDADRMRKDLKGDSPDAVALRQVLGKNEELQELLDDGIPYFYARIGSQFGTTKNGSRLVPLLLDSSEQLEMKITRDLVRDLGDEIFPNIPNKYVAYIGGPTDGLTTTVMQTLSSWMSEKRSGLGREGIISATRVEREKRLIRNESGRIIDVNRENLPWNESKLGERNDVINLFAQLGIMPTTDTEFTVVTALLGNKRIQRLTDKPIQPLRNYHKNRVGWILNPDNKDAYDFTVAAAYARLLGRLGRVSKDKNQSPDRRDRAKDLYDAALNNNPDPALIEALAAFEQVMHGNRFVRDSVQSQINAIRKGTTFAQWRILETTHKTPFEGLPKLKFDRIKQTVIIGHFKDPGNPDFAEEVFKVNLRNGQVFKFDPRSKQFNDLEYGLGNTIIIPEATLPAVADSDSGLIKTLRKFQPVIKSTFLELINDEAKKAFQGIRLGESSQVYRPEFYIANALVEKALETGKFVGEGEATPVERMGPAEQFFYDPKTYPLDDVTDLAQMSLPEDDDNAEGVRRLRVQVSALHGAGMRAVDMAYRAALSDYAKGQFNDFSNKIAYGHDTVVLNELLAAFDGLENKWQVTFMPAVFNGDAKPTLMGHGVINENETYKVLGRAALLGQKFGQPNVFVTEETKSEDFGLKKDGYIVVPAVSYKLSKPIDHVQFRKFVDTNPGVYNGALLSQTESGEQLMTLFMVPGSDIGRSESKAWTDMVREGIEDYFNESQSASTKQGEVIRAEHEADERLRLWNLGSSEFGGLGAYQEYEEVLGILRANAPDDALPDVWQNKSSATIEEINVAFRREVERGMSIALGRDIVLPSRIQIDASVGSRPDLALYLSEYRASPKDATLTDVRVLDAYMALQDALLKQYHALNVKFDFMPEKKVDGEGLREVLVRTPDGKTSFEKVPYGFENPYGVDYDIDDLSKPDGWDGFNEFQRNAALDIHTERHLYIFKTGTPEMYSGKTKVENPMMARSPITTESGEPMLWMDVLYAVNNVLSNGIYSSGYRPGKGLGYIQAAYSVHAMLTDDPWAMWALANELLVRRSSAVNMLHPEMPPNYALAYREINPDSTDGEWRSIQDDLETVAPSLPPLDFMYAGINQVDDRVRLFANQLRIAPTQLKQGANSRDGFSQGVPSYGPYNGTVKHIHETRGSRKLGGYEPIFDSDLTIANGKARQVELRDGSKYWIQNHDDLVRFAVKSIKKFFTGHIHRALNELANGQSVIVSPSDWARMSATSKIELRIKPGQSKAGRIKDKKRRPGFTNQYTEESKTKSLLYPTYMDDPYSKTPKTREVGPDQWLAAAAALVWEIENKGSLIDKAMYRGADLWAMDKTHGVAEFSTADNVSENFALNQDFVNKKGYSIIEFPPDSLKAIKTEDYSNDYVTEEGYIVLTLDYQGYPSETRMPSMRASQLQTRNYPVISVPSPKPGAGAATEAAASMQAMITQVMAPVKGVDFKDIMFIADPDADRGAVEVNLPTMTVVGNFTKDQLDWVRRYRQQGNEGVSFFNINTTDPAEIIKQFYGDIDDDVIDMAQSTMDIDDDVIDMAQSSMPSASATTTTTGTATATGRASVNPLLRAVFALNQIMRAGASGDASPILMQNFIQANLLENPDMMMRQIKLIGQILRNPNMGVEIRLSNGNTITRGSMAGRKFFDEVLESEVRGRRNYDEAIKAGLSLAAITRQKALDDLKLKKPNATYADIDELGYNSDAGSDVEFLKHMPGQGLSERYFALSKDIVKMNTWDQMVKTLVELGYNPTPWKYELDPATGQQRVVHTTWTRALVDLAHLLNVTAGDIRFVDDDDTDERIARLGKLMFFAPRWLTSRLILNGWGRTMIEFAGSRFGKDGENWAHRVLAVNGMSRGQLARRSSAVAAIHGRLMYKAYMQWLALILGIYALGATNPHTMKVSVEGSLTKFQIGDYSFRAPGAIMAQVELTAAVLDAMNAFNAQTPGPQAKSKLEMVWESVSRVLMSRASPVISAGAEVLTGKDAFGEPAFIPDEAVDRFYSEVIHPSLSAAGITEPKDMKINRAISRRMMWWWMHDMMELYDAERKVGVAKADALLKSTALGAYSSMGGRVSFLSNRLKWEREAMQRMQATPGIEQIFTGATPEPEIDGLYTEVDENQPTEVPMPLIGAISADYNEELPGYDPYNQPLR